MALLGIDPIILIMYVITGFILFLMLIGLIMALGKQFMHSTKLRMEAAVAGIFLLGMISGGIMYPVFAGFPENLNIGNMIVKGLMVFILFLINYVVLYIVMRRMSEEVGVIMTVAADNLSKADEVLFPYTSKESDPISPVYKSLARLIDHFHLIINELNNASKLVAESTTTIYQSAEGVSKSAQSISNIMEQISSGTQAQVNEAHDAKMGVKQLKEALDEGFSKISDAVTIINEISEETNLLALNASIEAERAGEYGLGFNVVAQKVRELADQSKIYAERIAELIESIETSARDVRESLEQRIERINEVVENTAAGAEEVVAATEEQSASLEELTASTRELTSLSKSLKEIINQFY